MVDTLLSDNEFIDTLIALRGNRMCWAPGLVRLFARRTMKSQLAGVSTVEGFQALSSRASIVVEATRTFLIQVSNN